MLKRILAAVFVLLALPALGKERLTVVELFTSQACPNCPPAHEVALDVAEMPGVLMLSWAVDYWNFMGWQDTFAKAAHTERQRTYNNYLGEPGVYTPEIVIDGQVDVIGSRRDEVLREIAAARAQPDPYHRVKLTEDGSFCIVDLFEAEVTAPVTVRAVWYSEREDVSIGSGSNRGRTISYVNVVRESRSLGEWNGSQRTIKIPLDEADEHDATHLAVLLEDSRSGAILGAARLAMP